MGAIDLEGQRIVENTSIKLGSGLELPFPLVLGGRGRGWVQWTHRLQCHLEVLFYGYLINLNNETRANMTFSGLQPGTSFSTTVDYIPQLQCQLLCLITCLADAKE